jgi:hypothetical protein
MIGRNIQTRGFFGPERAEAIYPAEQKAEGCKCQDKQRLNRKHPSTAYMNPKAELRTIFASVSH